ncbi:MAG: hypothetical protein ACFFD4_19435 [Candidatus Odinarchaeota archaeon]
MNDSKPDKREIHQVELSNGSVLILEITNAGNTWYSLETGSAISDKEVRKYQRPIARVLYYSWLFLLVISIFAFILDYSRSSTLLKEFLGDNFEIILLNAFIAYGAFTLGLRSGKWSKIRPLASRSEKKQHLNGVRGHRILTITRESKKAVDYEDNTVSIADFIGYRVPLRTKLRRAGFPLTYRGLLAVSSKGENFAIVSRGLIGPGNEIVDQFKNIISLSLESLGRNPKDLGKGSIRVSNWSTKTKIGRFWIWVTKQFTLRWIFTSPYEKSFVVQGASQQEVERAVTISETDFHRWSDAHARSISRPVEAAVLPLQGYICNECSKSFQIADMKRYSTFLDQSILLCRNCLKDRLTSFLKRYNDNPFLFLSLAETLRKSWNNPTKASSGLDAPSRKRKSKRNRKYCTSWINRAKRNTMKILKPVGNSLLIVFLIFFVVFCFALPLVLIDFPIVGPLVLIFLGYYIIPKYSFDVQLSQRLRFHHGLQEKTIVYLEEHYGIAVNLRKVSPFYKFFVISCAVLTMIVQVNFITYINSVLYGITLDRLASSPAGVQFMLLMLHLPWAGILALSGLIVMGYLQSATDLYLNDLNRLLA